MSALARGTNALFIALLVLSTAMLVVTINYVFLATPIEARMGIVQKIFYFHAPSAYAMYIGAGACFVGSMAYLLKPTDARDAFARAGAEVAVAFGLIVLVTGPLWARYAWGTYWTWDPRLTTLLLSVFIYIAYLVLRGFTDDGAAERRFASALGIIGGPILPVIHFSVQKWGGQHPTVITGNGGGLDPKMKIAFGLAFFAFTLFAASLLWARTRLEIVRGRLARVEEEAIDLGLDTRTEI